jgi:hypothetical protein
MTMTIKGEMITRGDMVTATFDAKPKPIIITGTVVRDALGWWVGMYQLDGPDLIEIECVTGTGGTL